MKKFLFLSLTLFFFTASFTFAQKADTSSDVLNEDELIFTQDHIPSSTDDDDLYDTINFLIVNGLFKNQIKIKELSKNLSEESRLELFEKRQSDAKQAKSENLKKGYGLGSLDQGDYNAFLPHAIIDGIGSLAFYGGSTVAIFMITWDFLWNFIFIPVKILAGQDIDQWTWLCPKIYPVCGILAASGFTLMLTSRLISLAWPQKYKTKFDSALKDALNLNDNIENVSLNPIFIPADNPVLGLALKIDF